MWQLSTSKHKFESRIEPEKSHTQVEEGGDIAPRTED